MISISQIRVLSACSNGCTPGKIAVNSKVSYRWVLKSLHELNSLGVIKLFKVSTNEGMAYSVFLTGEGVELKSYLVKFLHLYKKLCGWELELSNGV